MNDVNDDNLAYQDRRPWLIISRREALALVDAARSKPGRPSNMLSRALSVIQHQLDWINGTTGVEPDVRSTLDREFG